jgi:hypothetical protein
MCQPVNILPLFPIFFTKPVRNTREIIVPIHHPFFAQAASTRVMRLTLFREVDVALEAFTGPLDPIESTVRISTEHENE